MQMSSNSYKIKDKNRKTHLSVSCYTAREPQDDEGLFTYPMQTTNLHLRGGQKQRGGQDTTRILISLSWLSSQQLDKRREF